jgi:hypothetical protein
MDRAAGDLSNGVNVEAFNKLAAAYFKAEDDKATLFAEYRNACKGPTQAKKKAFQAARDAGVPLEAAKVKLRLMALDRRKEKIRAAQEPDTLALIIQIEVARKELGALADSPLGQAHLEAVKAQRAAALNDFADDKTGDPGQTAEQARVAANIEALKGIKQLPPDKDPVLQ